MARYLEEVGASPGRSGIAWRLRPRALLFPRAKRVAQLFTSMTRCASLRQRHGGAEPGTDRAAAPQGSRGHQQRGAQLHDAPARALQNGVEVTVVPCSREAYRSITEVAMLSRA